MSYTELLPALIALDAEDKARVVHFLQEELLKDEGKWPFPPNAEIPIWSPFDACEAAATLEKLLGERQAES